MTLCSQETSLFDRPVPIACRLTWDFLVQCVCSQLGILVLVVAWSLIGAVVFEKLESARFTKTGFAPDQDGARVYDYADVAKARTDVVFDLATELRQVTQTEPIWRQKIEQYLIKYEKMLMHFFNEGKLIDGAVDQWDFVDAWFFSISVLTTLGMYLKKKTKKTIHVSVIILFFFCKILLGLIIWTKHYSLNKALHLIFVYVFSHLVMNGIR
jgi:hypothetical protein